MAIDKSVFEELTAKNEAALAELRNKEKELRNEITELAKGIFNEVSKAIFDAFPKVVAFRWRQYTPYFNDGDECVFSARTDDFEFQYGNEEDLDDYYFTDEVRVEDGTEQRKSWRGVVETVTKYKWVKREVSQEELEKNEAYSAVKAFLSNFDNNDLKTMFGDHVAVTVNRGGVSVDEYSHD